MGHYTQAEIPFQFALADAFTLCDNYHSSVLTGTDPNRIFFFSGARTTIRRGARKVSTRRPDTSEPNNLRCWITGHWPDPGYTYAGNGFDWPTIPDVLQAAGISWRIYQDPNDNWTGAMNGCLAFNSFRNAKKGSPIYEQGMSLWLLDRPRQACARGDPAAGLVDPAVTGAVRALRGLEPAERRAISRPRSCARW